MNDGLTLRQVRESDRWTLWGWRSSDRIRSVSFNDQKIPRSAHDEWFTKHFPTMRDRTIIVEWNGSPVGWYQIEKWDPATRSGEWGIALGEETVPLGLGGVLPILALSHAFDRIGAEQMTGRVLTINPKMLSIMKRLKIRRIGIGSEPVHRVDGTSTEAVVFQIQRSEWNEVLDAGRLLIPSSLRAFLDQAIGSPVRG